MAGHGTEKAKLQHFFYEVTSKYYYYLIAKLIFENSQFSLVLQVFQLAIKSWKYSK